LLIVLISFLLLVCRVENGDDDGDDNSGRNTPSAFIHVCHVTNRFNTTVAMSIWHYPVVRVFSDDTWEQNIRLLLIIIVRPYWLPFFFFSTVVTLSGYVILVQIRHIKFCYGFILTFGVRWKANQKIVPISLSANSFEQWNKKTQK